MGVWGQLTQTMTRDTTPVLKIWGSAALVLRLANLSERNDNMGNPNGWRVASLGTGTLGKGVIHAWQICSLPMVQSTHSLNPRSDEAHQPYSFIALDPCIADTVYVVEDT